MNISTENIATGLQMGMIPNSIQERTVDPDENPYRLITDRMARETPDRYGTEDTPLKEKLVQAIYFIPFHQWSWYLVELDVENQLAWGLVIGEYPEWGYFSMKEIADVGVQRLLVHKPRTFEEMKETELKNNLTKDELGRLFCDTLAFDGEEELQ